MATSLENNKLTISGRPTITWRTSGEIGTIYAGTIKLAPGTDTSFRVIGNGSQGGGVGFAMRIS